MPLALDRLSTELEAAVGKFAALVRRVGLRHRLSEADLEDVLARCDGEAAKHFVVQGAGLDRHDCAQRAAEQTRRMAGLAGDEVWPPHDDHPFRAARIPAP